MRNKPVQAPQSPGWESVDETMIHEGRGASEPDMDTREPTPPPPLRVLPKFGGNLDPQTLPTHILQLPVEEQRQPEPAPAYRAPARPAPRPAPEPRYEEPAYETAPRGKVIVVFGCRGGAGATMLAVNVGAQLVRTGRSVCVLDLDLQLGDVFVALDLEANTSISAVAREAKTLDAAALRRRLVRHDSGLYCLSQT